MRKTRLVSLIVVGKPASVERHTEIVRRKLRKSHQKSRPTRGSAADRGVRPTQQPNPHHFHVAHLVLTDWIKEQERDDAKILFPSIRGGSLSSDSVQYLVAKYVTVARTTCPSLSKKRVSPHVLRHTSAMELLQAGVDRSLIALWLGHESVETTQIYLDADLAKTTPIKARRARYRPDDELLSFLKGL